MCSDCGSVSKQRRRRQIAWLLLLAMTIATFTGCIVIPVDYYQAGMRRNVSEKTAAKLEPGKTKKGEVFLLLGEPDFASEDGGRIGYAWTKVKALIIVASYGGSGAAEIERSYVLEISFGDDVVREARVMKEWGSQVPPIHELKDERKDRQGQ